LVKEDEAIEILASAYGVPVSVDAIADAIGSDSELPPGESERNALISIVNVLVGSQGAIEAIQTGDALPQGTLSAMTEAARAHLTPADSTPSQIGLSDASPAAVVELATRSVRRQLV
jgi:hypothetical protein